MFRAASVASTESVIGVWATAAETVARNNSKPMMNIRLDFMNTIEPRTARNTKPPFTEL
jgi:hypothetical protein